MAYVTRLVTMISLAAIAASSCDRPDPKRDAPAQPPYRPVQG